MPPQHPPATLTTVRSLLAGTALNVAGRAATLLLGLALLVVVARMGPQVQGALALLMALDGLLVALFSGAGLALAREAGAATTAAGAGRVLLRQRLLARALAVLGLGLVVVCAGAALAAWLAPAWAPWWWLALGLPIMLLGPLAQGLWMGQGRLGWLNAAQAASPAAVLALLGVLLALDAPAWPVRGPEAVTGVPGTLGAMAAVLAAWVVGRALVGLGSVALAARGLAPPGGAGTAAPAAPGWAFLAAVAASNVISLLNLRATLFIVEHHGGLAAAGVYSVAVQVAELLWVLSAAVSVAAYHTLRPGDPAAARLAWRAVRLGLGLALAAAPLLAAAAWWGLPALLGPDYAAARLPLLLLLPGVVAYAAASALSAFHTQALGRPQWAATVAGSSLLLTLTIAAWAVPHWGAAGAAIATSTAYLLAMAWVLPAFWRRHRGVLRPGPGGGAPAHAARQSRP